MLFFILSCRRFCARPRTGCVRSCVNVPPSPLTHRLSAAAREAAAAAISGNDPGESRRCGGPNRLCPGARAALAASRPGVRAALERTLTLLAFDNPAQSPVGDLLAPERRAEAAAAVNAALLRAAAVDVEPRLPSLLRTLDWAQAELAEAGVVFPRLSLDSEGVRVMRERERKRADCVQTGCVDAKGVARAMPRLTRHSAVSGTGGGALRGRADAAVERGNTNDSIRFRGRSRASSPTAGNGRKTPDTLGTHRGCMSKKGSK